MSSNSGEKASTNKIPPEQWAQLLLERYVKWHNTNALMSEAIKRKKTQIATDVFEARAAFSSFYLDTVFMLVSRGVNIADLPDPSTFGTMAELYEYYKKYIQFLFDHQILSEQKEDEAKQLIKKIMDKEV
jgi:hypothetical protein